MTTATLSAVAPLIRAAALVSQGNDSAGIADARRVLRALAAGSREEIAELLACVLVGANVIENQRADEGIAT